MVLWELLGAKRLNIVKVLENMHYIFNIISIRRFTKNNGRNGSQKTFFFFFFFFGFWLLAFGFWQVYSCQFGITN